MLRRYLWRILISVDQFANTLLGGYSDETISARAGRYAGKLWYWTGLAWVLNKIDPGHTEDAIKSEKERKHYPPVYRPNGANGDGSNSTKGSK